MIIRVLFGEFYNIIKEDKMIQLKITKRKSPNDLLREKIEVARSNKNYALVNILMKGWI